jgi:hypothetical protein
MPDRLRRRLVPALLLVYALIGPGVSPGHAQTTTPIPASFFAISPIHSADFPPLSFGTEGHPDFTWTAMEPSRGVFDFTVLDPYVYDARNRGLYDPATNTVRIVLTLGLTPSWAVTDQKTCTRNGANGLLQCTAPPDSVSDWTAMLQAMVAHYNGVNAPHIQYYELWNEANDKIWWTPPPGDTFTTLIHFAQIAYPIIHTDPVSQLLTPSVAGTIDRQASWMAGYLQEGGAAYADLGVYHGYTGSGATPPYVFPESDSLNGSVITKATRMRAVFDTCGLAGRPMMMTEGSWGNATVADSVNQTAWLARYMLLHAGMRSTTNLQLADWFCWGDSAFGWGDLEDGAGRATAAANAYTRVFDWLVGATLAAPFSGSANGNWIGTITRGASYTGKIVWNVNGSAWYHPPGPLYTRWRDLAGNTFAIAAGDSVPIGLRPVLVEKGTLTAVALGVPAGRLRLSAWPSVTRDATRLQFGAVLAVPGTVTVRDVAGRLVRTLEAPRASACVTWDGRAADGRAVPSGVYFARLTSSAGAADARVIVAR